MASKNSTVKALSAPRIRSTQTSKAAPIPFAQRAEKAKERERVQQEIDDAVDEWFTTTTALASTLAERFSKKPRYFLDIFFHGGARMLNRHEKINPKNAFIAMKARELRESGVTMNLVELQNEFIAEYENLDENECENIVESFKESQQLSKTIRRPSPRGRIQDVSRTIHNIKQLIDGLKNRVGIEGFFCIVRNTPEFHMEPQWHFTSEAIANYMPIVVRKRWDTHDIGIKVEAFAIAGCDPVNLHTTSKKKAEYIKNEIRDRVNTMLVDITGNPKAVMRYVNYEVDIVQRYGIVLQGWTYQTFVNPSELSTSLPPLRALLSAIADGTCKFVKLTPAELKKRQDIYDSKVASGDIVERPRKRRKDAGSTTKPAKRARNGKSAVRPDDRDADDDDESDTAQPRQVVKSSEFVTTD